jgi:hypothetical protein
VAVLASPLADRRGLLAARPNGLVVDRLLLGPAGAATGAPPAGLARHVDERRQCVAQLRGVLLRQVDLVLTAFEGEVDGA